MPEKERWSNGNGYLENKKFFADIQKYGWDSFSHEIVKDGINYSQAKILETKLISEYNSVDEGYNNLSGNNSDVVNYNFFDFAIVNNKKLNFKPKNNSFNFAKIPNMFIRKNITTEFGLNRIFLVVYMLINKNRTYEDKSHITARQVLAYCGYKESRHKPKIFYEVIKSILFLKENYYIDTDFDMYSSSYNDCININILSDNFDSNKDFTKLYNNEFETLMSIDSKPTKESLLICYLYIKSYIIPRRKNDEGNEVSYNHKNSPEAFYCSIENMAKELSMSKDTINQCIEYLTTTTDTHNALLVKREVGSVKSNKSKPPQNVPNIYVLNKLGYQQEIEWALHKMMKLYEVDGFDEIKGGNKNG